MGVQIGQSLWRDPQQNLRLVRLYLRAGVEDELRGDRLRAVRSFRSAHALIDRRTKLRDRHEVTRRLAGALLALGDVQGALCALAPLTPDIARAAPDVRFFHFALLARTLSAAGRGIEARARYAYMLAVAEEVEPRARFTELALCASFLAARGERDTARSVLLLLERAERTPVATFRELLSVGA